MKTVWIAFFLFLASFAQAQISAIPANTHKLSLGTAQEFQTTELDVNPKLLFSEMRLQTMGESYYDETFGYAAITAGLPGIINLNIGGYSDFVGGQISISAIQLLVVALTACNEDEDEYDDEEEDNSFFFVGQLNLGIRLVTDTEYLITATCAAGTAFYDDGDPFNTDFRFFYIGPTANIFYKRFFLEAGWAWGVDIGKIEPGNTTQFPLIQIGYVGTF